MVLNDVLVTVIMPSYNASNTIGRAIDSVISQEFENWELIIVDDCSSDDTRSVVEPYLSEKIKLVELSENSGSPAKPRNVALSLAKGDYIAFLDSDDVWYVNKLSRQISYMLASGSKFSCTGYDIADENRNYKFIPPKLINYNDLIKNNTIGCLTAIVDAEVLLGYEFPVCGHEDFALWLNIIKEVKEVHGIPDVLAQYNVIEGSVSSDKIRVLSFFWNIYRGQEGFGFIKSTYFCAYYAVNSLFFKY